jgi:orotidine-5'-phosphate decarboxylase
MLDTTTAARGRLVFPLDFATLAEARAVAARLAPGIGVLKVGLELFVSEGPAAAALGAELGLEVFLDLKLHDIPETVDRAVASAAALGVRYLTVHAAGGAEMLRRAVERAKLAPRPLTILAVTVLTSLDEGDLRAQGVEGTPSEQVLRLARGAWGAGVRGFVASPAEVRGLREALGPEALLVIPGIRPTGAAAGDQKRIATPASAIGDGADLLVVGRPIRDAADPVAAAAAVVAEIERALLARVGAPGPEKDGAER